MCASGKFKKNKATGTQSTLQILDDAIALAFRVRLTRVAIKSRRVIHDGDAAPLRLDLPHGPREPCPRPQEPAAEGPERDDADGDGGVVERLAVDGVELREAEDDGDEGDVEACDGGDGAGQRAQVEGALCEIGRVDEADEDGEAVGDVEADGGDGGGGREGDAGPERGDGEEEGEEGGQADGPDGGLVFRAHCREERRQAVVAGEAEHHAGIRRH